MTSQKPTNISSAERDMENGGSIYLKDLPNIKSGLIYRVYGKHLHDSKTDSEMVLLFFSPPKTDHNIILSNITIVTVTKSNGIKDASTVDSCFSCLTKSVSIEQIFQSIESAINAIHKPIISEIPLSELDSTLKKMDFNFKSIYDSFLFFTNTNI